MSKTPEIDTEIGHCQGMHEGAVARRVFRCKPLFLKGLCHETETPCEDMKRRCAERSVFRMSGVTLAASATAEIGENSLILEGH
jgi:hypothetical protein